MFASGESGECQHVSVNFLEFSSPNFAIDDDEDEDDVDDYRRKLSLSENLTQLLADRELNQKQNKRLANSVLDHQ